MSNYSKLIYSYDRYFFIYIDNLIKHLPKPTRKFYIDIVYGILKSKSILLSNISHSLNENILLKKTIERLSRLLNSDIDSFLQYNNYFFNLSLMNKELKHFIVDDTDVVKIYGKHFESLGIIKDGSAIKQTFEKGYRVTSIIGLSKETKHPLPFYDKFHSETQKGFTSINQYTLNGILSIINLLDEYSSIFTFDRGYDDNKLIRFFNQNKQYFVIRLTKKRKIVIKNKRIKIMNEALKKKGKIIIPITYKGDMVQIKASHMKVKLIGFKSPYYIVFAYLNHANEPLMLLTNKPIKSKNEVIEIVYSYCSRWKIEEYFRFKKVEFDFENFRVRNLKSINHLTFCLDLAISFLTNIIENKTKLYYDLISLSKNLKNDKSYLKYYQLISGINSLLGHKEKGIKAKQKIEHRKKAKQLKLF